MPFCLNCNASEKEKPLLLMKFQGGEIYICPQCRHLKAKMIRPELVVSRFLLHSLIKSVFEVSKSFEN